MSRIAKTTSLALAVRAASTRDCLHARLHHRKRHRALIVDTGLMGEPACTADISNAQVAEAGGSALALLAFADAAKAARSPVIVGFNGIYLPHPARRERDRLAPYAAMALAVCRNLTVPTCLLLNEPPHADWVAAAIDQGFRIGDV
jgi:hypothetical protein